MNPIDEALASVRAEGLVPSQLAVDLLERIFADEISVAEAVDILISHHRKEI